MTIYNTYTDEELVTFLQQGDEDAFEAIFDRYWEPLFIKAGYKLGDLALAEEIVQDIFMDIWVRRAELQLTGKLAAYLATALKYQVIKYHEKQKRELAYARHTQQVNPASDNTTEKHLQFNELQKRLESLVSQLPEKCRIVYKLREEGYSQREISKHMGISENTVETHIARALKSIRTGLSQFFTLFF